MSLSVLQPISITDAMFISSSVTETDYSAYNAATTYALGAYCISTTTHRVYQSLIGGNFNHDPTDINNRVTNLENIIYWLDYGPTNKWAALDGKVSTQTIGTSPLTIVISPGFFNCLYLGGLEADTLTVTVRDNTAGNIVYASGTINLEQSTPTDYYDYFFSPFKPKTKYLISGIEAYYLAEMTIVLTKVTGSVKCGLCATGDLSNLGTTLNGATATPKTYSYIDIDKFGNNTIIKRKAATDMSLTAFLDTTEATSVLQRVQAVLDVPCVWVASECVNYSSLTIFGLGSANLTYVDSSKSELSLTVQGLI